MANFQVKDGYGSIITIQSSTFGGVERQIVGVSIIGGISTTPSGNQSVSGTVGASIIGLTPVTFSGSPSISGAVTVVGNHSISGTVNVGNFASTSVYGIRNDAVASFLGADLTVRPIATDSAGRVLTKPFSANESRIEGNGSVVGAQSVLLVAAAGAGLRNYVTDFFLSNTGATTTLVQFTDGSDSILGQAIAPTGGGFAGLGLQTPMRTAANSALNAKPLTATSILYVTALGYKAP